MKKETAGGIVALAATLAIAIVLFAHPAQGRSFCSGLTWQKAAHRVGKTVTLSDTATAAKFVHWKSGKGTMTFLDFGGKYPNAKFTAIIWNKDASSLAGKHVCLTGKVTVYNGKPELSVND